MVFLIHKCISNTGLIYPSDQKQKKRYPRSLFSREIKIKITMRSFCTPTRMAKMKTKTKIKTKSWQRKDVEQLKFSYTADGHVY